MWEGDCNSGREHGNIVIYWWAKLGIPVIISLKSSPQSSCFPFQLNLFLLCLNLVRGTYLKPCNVYMGGGLLISDWVTGLKGAGCFKSSSQD